MANESLGANFSIDITKLRAGLKEANQLIRESQSEFKAAAAGMDDWTQSEEGLTAKLKSLTTTADIQREKVNALKQEYQRLIDSGLDPASNEASKLRTQINNEEAALARTEKELRDNTEALDKLGDETEETSEKTGKFTEALKTMGKVAAAAVGAAAAGLAAITKQAVEGYANYEQLVGGVETLFGAGGKSLEEYAKSVGKSVDEVKSEYEKLKGAEETMLKNANDAYKTAGMSANEYMENVTAFSASLISSLDGDTQAAAEAANQAMIDMSDNANKMGTDVQSIVETYQSLSRGNFQMLDNLKLGYGGTKSEMERLIADANAVKVANGEMADLSIDSFADMTEAIHIIQTEMGISGTTAKEASSTIQGSTAAMKAAWSNLVTGMADENANIDQLITNFIDSLGTMLENVLPRIVTATEGIIKVIERMVPLIPPLIAEFLPVIIDGIMNLLDGVASVLPTVIDTVLQVIPNLASKLIEMLPTLIETTIKIIGQIINAISGMIPTIVDSIMKVIPLIISSIVKSVPEILKAAINLLMALIKAIPVIVKELTKSLPEIINTILTMLTENIPVLFEGATMFFNAIIEALPQIIEMLVEALPNIVNTVVNGLIQSIPELLNAAIEFLMSIVEAIPLILPELINAVPEIIKSITGVLMQNIPLLLNAAIQLLTAVIDAIPIIVQELIKYLPMIIVTIVAALIDSVPELIKASITLFTAIITAIPQILPEIIKAIPQIIKAIFDALTSKEAIDSIKQAGKDLIKGLWNGISDMAEWIKEKIKGFGDGVLGALKDFFGIESPSKLMRDQVGKNLALGIGEGFTKNIGKVNDEIVDAMNFDDPQFNISGTYNGRGHGNGKTIVVNQYNTYSQAHSRYEIYKSKQQTAAAVRLAMAGA